MFSRQPWVLPIEELEARFAELGEEGGDPSLNAVLKLLYDQLAARTELEESLVQGRMTLATVAGLLVIGLVTPVPAKIAFLGAVALALLYHLPAVWLAIRTGRGTLRNEHEIFRIHQAALDAVVMIVRGCDLSPYALEPEQQALIRMSMAKTGRHDLALEGLLHLSLPSPEAYSRTHAV